MPEQAFSLSSQSHTIYPNTETGSTYTKPYLNVIASHPCNATPQTEALFPAIPVLARMFSTSGTKRHRSQLAGHFSSISGKLFAIALTFHKNFRFYDHIMTYRHLSSVQPPSFHFFTISVDKSMNKPFLNK